MRKTTITAIGSSRPTSTGSKKHAGSGVNVNKVKLVPSSLSQSLKQTGMQGGGLHKPEAGFNAGSPPMRPNQELSPNPFGQKSTGHTSKQSIVSINVQKVKRNTNNVSQALSDLNLSALAIQTAVSLAHTRTLFNHNARPAAASHPKGKPVEQEHRCANFGQPAEAFKQVRAVGLEAERQFFTEPRPGKRPAAAHAVQ